MKKDTLRYFALWLFLAGVIVIVFFLFISGHNINRLITNNKRLTNEVRISNELRKLEADIITVESDIRGMVIAANTSQYDVVRRKINNIQRGLNLLKSVYSNSIYARDIVVLDHLMREKIRFSFNILYAFNDRGKAAAEAVISSGRGVKLTDSIGQVISRLDNQRQEQLHSITSSIERRSANARTWGIVLAAIACIICVLAFLYIVQFGREQHQMIVKLHESEKQVKEAAAIKDQFLANMSHEIRTPVNAILGFTSLLDKTPLDSEQSKYLSYIQSSSENLLIIVNDILDLSKIEAGMMKIETALFSLVGLVSSVETMFSEKARQKGLQFNVHIEPAKYDTLEGDAVRLTQILINLISNAIKFTEKGFVELRVKVLDESKDLVTVQFIVKDSGIGIAPEKQQFIFERFQQAEAETTRRFGGTGLGLSIVKQLADLQQGTIKVKSEEGKGSEFQVILSYVPVLKPIEELKQQPKESILSIKDAKLLIAEDNKMNQHLMMHLMNRWQIDFVMVSNGNEAIEAIKKSDFSLIIMDIQMPEMDGYTTTLKIRNELNLAIPIIAMTAHAMPGEKEKCIQLGMNDYLSKPVKEKDLYRVIQQYSKNIKQNSETRLIDLNYLKDLSNGDTEFEQTIISQFIVQVPEELQLLKEAIEKKDLHNIKALAHGMKSSVGYLGLDNKIYPALQRMESEAVNCATDAHFHEDYEQVNLLCCQAVDEACKLVGTVYIEQKV